MILTGILFAIYKGLAQRSRDNASPLLTVPAVVVAKRQEVRRSENSASNAYYLTFEVQGHDRVEFPVLGQQWGTILEGDRGRLTYQAAGSRASTAPRRTAERGPGRQVRPDAPGAARGTGQSSSLSSPGRCRRGPGRR